MARTSVRFALSSDLISAGMVFEVLGENLLGLIKRYQARSWLVCL